MSSLRFGSFLVTAAALVVSLVDCTQKPVSQPIRSLERSGKIALVCLDPDLSVGRDSPNYPLEQCGTTYASRPDGSGLGTHVIALVNQTSRGEVAVLDITYGNVVDVDTSSPGYNFLPVGQQPVDIVASPEGTAAFVASAEANRPGIYAIPARHMMVGGPTIRAWPACSLPSRPGAMALVVGAATPATCDAPNWSTDLDAGRDPNALALEKTHPNGNLSLESRHPGTQKLVVSLPTEGDLLVIDAQRLLDRNPGSFEPCPIERKVKLHVDLPPVTTLGNTPSAPVCPPHAQPASPASCPIDSPIQVTYSGDFSPMPAAFAFEGTTPGTQDGSRLFVSDLKAPVVHVVDLADPCNPIERAPLLPSAFDEPGRPVTTNAISLSPITRDLKQYLYAVDEIQGAVMVFDVSKTTGTRSPLVRPRPDFFPYTARDRLSLGSPVRAISFFTQELPYDDGTGNLLTGVSCNPTAAPTDIAGGGVYQPAADYSSGAGPRKLRGTFALAALTSGALVVIDVDDYDAPCRTYQRDRASVPGSELALPSWITGCLDDSPANGGAVCATKEPISGGATNLGGATGEYSCRVVDRHEVRSAYFIANTAQSGPRSPEFVNYAQLTYKSNTVRDDNSMTGATAPRIRGPLPPGGMGGATPTTWRLLKGGTLINVDADPNATATDGSVQNFVIADIREPRTAIDQDWTLTYQGAIPGFDGKVARLVLTDAKPGERGVYDPSAGFCNAGVHDARAAHQEATRLLAANNRLDVVEAYAAELTDTIEIANPLLDEADPYWSAPAGTCTFLQCRANFGTAELPFDTRQLKIVEAYQDHVLTEQKTIYDLTQPGQVPIAPECCFPTLVSYRVRGGQGTWIALGSATGF